LLEVSSPGLDRKLLTGKITGAMLGAG